MPYTCSHAWNQGTSCVEYHISFPTTQVAASENTARTCLPISSARNGIVSSLVDAFGWSHLGNMPQVEWQPLSVRRAITEGHDCWNWYLIWMRYIRQHQRLIHINCHPHISSHTVNYVTVLWTPLSAYVAIWQLSYPLDVDLLYKCLMLTNTCFACLFTIQCSVSVYFVILLTSRTHHKQPTPQFQGFWMHW